LLSGNIKAISSENQLLATVSTFGPSLRNTTEKTSSHCGGCERKENRAIQTLGVRDGILVLSLPGGHKLPCNIRKAEPIIFANQQYP
jgi:hypothetical protein